MVVISKVVAVSAPQPHAANLYIEALELVHTYGRPNWPAMMRHMQRISNAHHGDVAAPSEVAWEQGTRRRLLF